MAILSILLLPLILPNSQFLGNSGPLMANACNYIHLVKCFVEVIDDWAMTLYKVKDNVVLIDVNDCDHLRELDKCVNDESDDVEHNCRHDQVIEASEKVTDLLTHKEQSGSFLSSYYLLQYACSDAGRKILDNQQHRACLEKESIGAMTMSAATYLTDKFISDKGMDSTTMCSEIEKKLVEYNTWMKNICQGDAAELMCESLKGLFTGMYSDRLGDCEFNCKVQLDTTQLPTDGEHLGERVQPHAAANNGDQKKSALSVQIFSKTTSLFAALSVILLAVLLS